MISSTSILTATAAETAGFLGRLDAWTGIMVDWAWSIFLVVLLIGAGVFFTIRGGLPLRHIGHTFAILRGKYDDASAPGEISHLQALSAALSATVGMGNIAGVAIALVHGGPGAVFWMWVAGLVGTATKFFTCTLSCMYRAKDSHGIEQGGPMYFIVVGLGPTYRPLAIWFAVCGMIGCLALFQINQLSGLMYEGYAIPRWSTGIVATTLVAIVILGGIVRVGKVAERLVPIMASVYVLSALFILVRQLHAIPAMLATIVRSAFNGGAVLGGTTALTVMQTAKQGVKRAAFSNEAGLGTSPMAHGAAKTTEPVREGLIAMLEPIIDTNIVCTMTALVILSTGITPNGDDGVVITTRAFEAALPGIGRYLLTAAIVLFSISTMMSYSYYSQKCAKFLFGDDWGHKYIYIYLVVLPIAAIWSQDGVVNMLDTAFALMGYPTLIGALLLSPRVAEAATTYFRGLANAPESSRPSKR